MSELTPETLRVRATLVRGAYRGRYMLELADRLDACAAAWEKQVAELRAELAAVMDVAIARGETLGFLDADNDYRKRAQEL